MHPFHAEEPSAPTAQAIDAFNAERFRFMNSGFSEHSPHDQETARQLSLKMLESAMRLNADATELARQLTPPAQVTTPKMNGTIW